MDCPSYATGGNLQEVVYCCNGETILMRAGREEGRIEGVLDQCIQLLTKERSSSSNVVLSFTISVLAFLFLSGIATATLVHFRSFVVRVFIRIIDFLDARLARGPPVPVAPVPGRPVLYGPQHPAYQPESASASESETESNLAVTFPDEGQQQGVRGEQGVQGGFSL